MAKELSPIASAPHRVAARTVVSPWFLDTSGCECPKSERGRPAGERKVESSEAEVINGAYPTHLCQLALTVAALSASLASAQPNSERDAYFGETHIHTSWSVDAWVMGSRVAGPDDALEYAQGRTIKQPMGFEIKIGTPLDFMGVTDHSEYVGVTREANIPGS